MNRLGRLALAVYLATLAGCSLFERSAEPAPVTAPESAPVLAPLAGRSTAQELMAYMGKLRTMNETSLAAETTRQRQAAQKQPTDVARLKVAMRILIGCIERSSSACSLEDNLASV